VRPPPDAQEAPARASSATLFDSLQGTPGGETSSAIPRCWVCMHLTLRTGHDGRPVHAACEPRDAGITDPETSQSAAKAAQKGARSPLARKVYDLLADAWPDGLTDDELSQALPDQPIGSIAKRRLDLCRAGRVGRFVTEAKRATRWGREAYVWRAEFPEDPL